MISLINEIMLFLYLLPHFFVFIDELWDDSRFKLAMVYSYQVHEYYPLSCSILPIWLLVLITHIAFGFISLLDLGSILWPLMMIIYISFGFTVIVGIIVSCFAETTFSIIMGIFVIVVHELFYCIINLRIRFQTKKLIKRQRLSESLERISISSNFKAQANPQACHNYSSKYLNSSLNEEDFA